ncbi:MAG: UbiA prenyltransferase family protein [Clostridia bacterium]|nr:UbiA prenyltransferase family protein [Clostridia bacterium]
MKKHIKLLRIKNYIKNALILVPAIFSKQLFDLSSLPSVLFGLISFCMLSSAVYIFNDLCDVRRDKLHPEKRNRPIANGSISRKSAIKIMAFLLIICIATNHFACGANPLSWSLLLIYFVLNILYSIKLKQIPILDVTIIASGFLIRVFYGSAILDIEVSKWLYLTVIAISFYIGFGKRRNELVIAENNETRSVLSFYNYNFLDKNMYVCSALTIVFYSLWSVDTSTIENFGNNALIWTVPLVILICITYSLTVEKYSEDDPIDIIFKNKFLLVLIALYGIAVIGIIYIF